MRKISLFFVLLLMVMPLAASAEVMPGDVDSNGKTDINDVTVLIDYLLNRDASSIDLGAADVNSDGVVNIVDVTTLIDIILLDELPQDDHEWVDLGLPSGTLWATCNVGADNPEDYGDYFAWGETEPKEVYNWSTYKWCNGSENTLTKYCTSSSFGTVDNKTELDPEDDAAYVNWSENWRIPTIDQQTELITKCTWKWTTQNGVKGRLVTGPNRNTLFLPAAGNRYDSSLYRAGSQGGYWVRTVYSSRPSDVSSLGFNSSSVGWGDKGRCYGFPVRAVRVPQN